MPDQEPTPGQYYHNRRYRLDRKIGQGGMGSVWLAVDEHLSEEVALKFLPPEIQHDPSSLDDMRHETSRSRRLAHPNIVRIHDMHEYPGEVPFISMEFIPGVSLSGLKAQQPKRCFPWDFLKTIIEQLCSALEYAHTEGVVHRDLKPGNVMFDDRGRVKLADFGIAAVATDSMSRVSLQGNTSGTPAYMSPQQMDGRSPRVTDDIYSLGAMIYELFTGKPPFFRGDIPHQVRTIDPPTIEDRLNEFGLKNPIPPEVSAMIMACLSKDPGNRPQSARAVSEWISTSSDPAVSGGVLAAQIFERSIEEDETPSGNELTVLPPDEPTDYSADEHEVQQADGTAPIPSSDSHPRLPDDQALPNDSADSNPGSPSQPPRPWKLIGAIVAALLLLVILGGMAKKKKRRTGGPPNPGREGNLNASTQADRPLLVSGPWRNAKPTEVSVGRMQGLYRPYELGTLDNCTVIVLEETPGQSEIKRSIKPWRPKNPYWSIDEGIVSVSLTRDSPGATKTFLVFNGQDLRSFLLAFVYRATEAKFDQGNFGVFYRCRNLDNWRFDGFGAVLGDNSGKLWGLPDDAYTAEHREFTIGSQPKMLKELMMQSRRSQLLQGGGHTCTIRTDGASASHVIDQRVGHNYVIEEPENTPESGTIVIEAWVRGAGKLAVSFEGMFIRTGRGMRPLP
jgi:serine/threonine protein kinase